MHRQTVDQVMNTMSMIRQPAFCLRSNGTVVYNEPARNLAPTCSAALPEWLGKEKKTYDHWDRSGKMHLIVHRSGLDYSVTLQALQDGTFFLMTPHDEYEIDTRTLAVTSQVLRGPLTELNALLHRYARSQNYEAAPLNRQMHRLVRIASNLTEIDRLNGPSPRISLSRIDVKAHFDSIASEVSALMSDCNREFNYVPPQQNALICVDTTLLNRAVYNLLSNAAKYSPDASAISLRVNVFGNHLVVQVENTCVSKGSDLLRSAFNRLTDRSLIPDPNWGIGLGIPIVHAIARLHDGTLALEVQGDQAVVTLALSSELSNDSILEETIKIDYSGGMRQSLLELSDILPNSVYE